MTLRCLFGIERSKYARKLSNSSPKMHAFIGFEDALFRVAFTVAWLEKVSCYTYFIIYGISIMKKADI